MLSSVHASASPPLLALSLSVRSRRPSGRKKSGRSASERGPSSGLTRTEQPPCATTLHVKALLPERRGSAAVLMADGATLLSAAGLVISGGPRAGLPRCPQRRALSSINKKRQRQGSSEPDMPSGRLHHKQSPSGIDDDAHKAVNAA
ncbi:hypothetical protein BU26DRAFT_503278 [Trematosphaeria pertusa]|uniref:Uncharacterized protein n=1 Tax=Trematosphaeria pertusa TaxID=390896 RepID=A0A6A6IMB3_9PLEO|nr:uncharacterized protein BU26DRAFT_503278 [Trematosphaeria pertusa]KAF2250623.1 hypothetical protein BU26DRAFT_503278 [Trematosphaeria pertusa]